MKELVILSGKGGTGKTSVTAAFAALAGQRAVLADCDVDAADLHLVLAPDIQQQHDFYSGHQAVIHPEKCTACGLCLQYCHFEAIVQGSASDRLGLPADASSACQGCSYCVRSCPHRTNAEVLAVMKAGGMEVTPAYMVDPISCEGCGVCAHFCPAGAIEMRPRLCGQWMISQTRFGPMVHARLGIAAENSGKLVSTVRQQAQHLAEQGGQDMVLIDGSPGIGCPVIASVTGADCALIVTEPTRSGMHDLQRVADLCDHFAIPALLCVNKWDINPALADEIEQAAITRNIPLAGRIRYDQSVTAAQRAAQSVIEHGSSPCAEDIRGAWASVSDML
jgi:MinD superfamily P-loop ATPase